MKNSIYSTKVVKDYLDTGKLYMDDSSKLRINKYLVNIINCYYTNITKSE